MPFILSVFVFAVFLVMHLVSCFLGLERARMVTKCMLMPFLIISLQAYGCDNILIYAALLFGLLGDLLIVVSTSKLFFMMGMLSFGINHLLNLVTIVSMLPYHLNIWHYIAAGILAILYIGAFGYFLRSYMPKVSFINGGYSYIILLNIITAVMLMISLYDKNNISVFLVSIVVLLGVIIFSISDTLIAINMYVKTLKRSSFFTMSTYLLAQVLIAFGLAIILKGI